MYYHQPTSWTTFIQKYFLLLIGLGILVNASGLFITILDSDGTLYANIAKTIAVSGDYINLKVSGKDWLDKPHLPFWLAAISYKIFGYTSFAYKLPAFLFWLIGLRYTYLFAKENYRVSTAQIAALIYVSATHLVISNNDVRAEPYLTGMIIASVYHLHKASKNESKWLHVLVGSLFAALAIMTKGPFVLITIGGGLVVEWIWKQDWKQFLNPIWWVCLLLISVMILPEIYCLYVQFDMHPEKMVFEKTGVSGVRFFFWDSQFGRFFNNGPIKGEGDYFFFLHTLLWAFLPWCFVLYASLGFRLKKINLRKQEQVTIWASLITLFIFSLSKFQLPHYTNILFPFFAIIAANYLSTVQGKAIQWMGYLQNVVAVCMLAVVVLLWYFFRP
ncbi:MAG: ArnT family glycosyltransferase, partial [Chitinophagaceae bacterium]